MPNWELARYHIEDTKANIEKLDAAFDRAESHDNDNGFGRRWLGNLLIELGFSYEQICHGYASSASIPNCRGNIENREKWEENLWLETETAWSPMDECIVLFVRTYCPDAIITRTMYIEVEEEL